MKLVRKPRNVSFLTQILTFLRIVGNPAVWIHPRVVGDTKQTDRPTDRQNDPLVDDNESENKRSSFKLHN